MVIERQTQEGEVKKRETGCKDYTLSSFLVCKVSAHHFCSHFTIYGHRQGLKWPITTPTHTHTYSHSHWAYTPSHLRLITPSASSSSSDIRMASVEVIVTRTYSRHVWQVWANEKLGWIKSCRLSVLFVTVKIPLSFPTKFLFRYQNVKQNLQIVKTQ